ncbi:MAG: biotin--[acetyl-CoA-carboxylase] ligase [Cellulosilyticaceae bacterium]
MYNEQTILAKISTAYIGQVITYFDTIGSTNDYAKTWARAGAIEGALVIADRQTAGKGRLGRVWDSPDGEGVWMSLIVRPAISPQAISQLTLVAGLSMCRAIRELTGLDAEIKWPNDIVVQGRKVCGILAEMGMQGPIINYVVIGVGVNVNTEVFGQDLPHASSLKLCSGHSYDRIELIEMFARYFEVAYDCFKEQGNLSGLIEDYKKCCLTLGKQVILIEQEIQRCVKVEDITDTGALLIRNEQGIIEEIHSGEVSVRGLYGYI